MIFGENIYNMINQNLIYIVLLNVVISLLISYIIWKKDSKWTNAIKIKMNTKEVLKIIGISILIDIVLTIILNVSDVENRFPSYENVMLFLTNSNIFVLIICTGILTPIVEEIIFRGIIFNRLKEYNIGLQVSIIIQAVIFGIIHFNIVQSTYAMIIGIFFAVIYEKKKTIVAPIIAHMTFNLFAIALVFLTTLNP
ncbi:MAG: CPBP family intramembrane metalloprotease [Oscillospiraceae bacterium]|nr:CPBP family intramembrane metalloprotease [Oscillospiraceae bacterium]